MSQLLGILIGFYMGVACHEEGRVTDGAMTRMIEVISENNLDALPDLHNFARTIVASKGSPPDAVCKNLEKAYGGRPA